MKINKILLVSISLLIIILTVSSVAAIDNDGGNVSVSTEDSNDDINQVPIDNLENDDNLENNILSSSNEEEFVGGGNIIVVEDKGDNHNEMTDPTIQKAINSAKPGDTIVITGKSYVHCHIIIDKKLTIVSNVSTVMTPCSSKATSNHQGIFYISPKASGTVIEGFTFKDDSMYIDNEGYGIFVKGASDVTIRNCNITTDGIADSIRLENAKNCVIEDVCVFNSINGINIKNSEGITVRNTTAKNNQYGINVVESTKTYISDSNICLNDVSGVAVREGSSFTTLIYNNLTNNKYAGADLTSSDNVNILSNYIAENKFGVYVNCLITKITINGNFFKQNTVYEVLNDYRTTNLGQPGSEKLEVINNNYMIGHDDRPVYNLIYKYVGKNKGSYSYDATNDVYTRVGAGKGDYDELKDSVFLGYTFEINEYVLCPVLYFSYNKLWASSGNYELQLSNLTQVKKGVYSISIVDANGNVATDLSSVYVYFYMNKDNNSPDPQEGDVYRKVLMKNGTATVKFNPEDFKESGNVLTASFPGAEKKIYDNPFKQLSISDDQIPGVMSNTSITVSNLNTYPKSGECLIATLRDENGNGLAGKKLLYDIVGKTYVTTTDANGQARLPINLKEGTYPANIRFVENDDYYGSSAKANVYVKAVTTQIISSNMNMVPYVAENFKVTLKDSSGKAIPNQKIVIKVDGKTYTKTTNSNGQVTVNLKFTSQKTYKLTINFYGTNKYKSASKTNSITVKYSSKAVKLTVPKLTVPPKTNKVYTISLKDEAGKGIGKETVTVTLDGQTFKRTTNANGLIDIKVNYPEVKNHKITVSYPGSKIYKSTSASNYIVVAKTRSALEGSNVVITPNTQKSYLVTLKGTDGKILANQKLIFTLDGKQYTKVTNNNGQASINVKFPSEKKYSIFVVYKGNDIYAGTELTRGITVQKTTTSLISSDKTFSKGSDPLFEVTLKDSSGKALSGQKITFTFNGQSQVKTTDSKGVAKVNVPSTSPTSFNIVSKYAGSGIYKAISKTNKITIANKTNTVFVNPGLSSNEIQKILDGCGENSNVEFLGNAYSDVALNVKKPLNIYSQAKTVLNGKTGSPVFNVLSSNVNISDLTIVAKSNSGITVKNADNVNIVNNAISNALDSSKKTQYDESTIPLPGYGVSLSNSNDVVISNNNISSFESGIFGQDSSAVDIKGNCLFENNYGIKYGYGVSNTNINDNKIVNNIGLYTMEVPEGPRGYGIFLNNSAVDVTITNNVIDWNHMGISVDAKNSTGIVIKNNHISDNVLEGIRFNAGYDLAENAVEPVVTNNAIYRNARGPSMMILGELSANPEGIYGPGQWDESLRLKLGPNWYGKNAIVTWDYDTGVVGWGTMCPRISTTPIAFSTIECLDSGKYSITFYNGGEIASELPDFDLYARLNGDVEVNFNVVNGVGVFGFNLSDYNPSNNVVEISVGSVNDLSRYYNAFYSQNVTVPEI